MSDNCKVARKKTILNYKQEQLFVAEGHSSCVLWEKIVGDNQDGSKKSIGIAFVGGARYTEPSTWEIGNSLTVLDCYISDTDVEVKSCVVVGADEMTGSSLYPLQGSAMVDCKSNDNNENRYSIYLWGRVNTKTMSCTAELIKLDIKEQMAKRARSATTSKRANFKVDVTVFAGAGDPDPNKKLCQSGSIPSERTGHSFTLVSNNQAVLFGGITMQKRDWGIFEQSCDDGMIYILDLKERKWSRINEELPPRAYHAAAFGQSNTLFITGGIQLPQVNSVQYCNMGEIMAINFDANIENITWSVLKIELVSPLYLSSHAAYLSDHILHILYMAIKLRKQS